METNAKQQVVERIKAANNVLVTVSTSPTVDQLASAIGLTLLLNKLGKHSTTVFSGEVPSTIEFLHPEKTIEKTTDSLRDFIISLDKSKADKLRYKVEDEVVKIFITPYRTSISEKDLEFGQGDFNVDVVVALGVTNQDELDQAIMAHGRILHDATVISIITGEVPSNLGSINWIDNASSSLCEMLVSISESFGSGLLDTQIATSFLTGIVSETERFKNEKTTPKVLTMSAQLVSAGANQQLIATELETPPPPPPAPIEPEPVAPLDNESDNQAEGPVEPPVEAVPAPEAPRNEVEVGLTHEEPPIGIEAPEHQEENHEESSGENHNEEQKNTDQEQNDSNAPALQYSMHEENNGQNDNDQTGQQHDDQSDDHHESVVDQIQQPAPTETPPPPPDPGLIEITHEENQEPIQPAAPDFTGSGQGAGQSDSAIHIDEHGNIMSGAGFSVTPPQAEAPSLEQAPAMPSPETDTPSAPSVPDMNLAPSDSLMSGASLPQPVYANEVSENAAATDNPAIGGHSLLPQQNGPAMSGAMEDARNEPPDAADILNLPPLDGRAPDAQPAPMVNPATAMHEAVIQPTETGSKAETVDDARDAVMHAIGMAPFDPAAQGPDKDLNAMPMPDSNQGVPVAPTNGAAPAQYGQPLMPPAGMQTPQATIISPSSPDAPPPGPPPMMPPIITSHGGPIAQPPVSDSQTPPPAV